ncbi:DUF4230 domain-containing protein [Fulvivirgaceae bacterium BMA10]|uniref:DUF4230 domain-containing protein n=1 Tax=Splendidivirga corallicola TaxID=3051826 RepID=A0ABT8KNN1_9BACT|nr:DUF4230 domain-containing protein [Fulvivirgaceae bacterium BMA10]
MKKFLYISFIIFFCLSCKEKKRHFVISKIQSAAKLATTETIIDKVVVGAKEKRLLGLVRISEANFVAHSQATVKTGIDMTKLKKEDVVIEGAQITLKLPAIEVLNFSYPFNKFDVDWDITHNAFLNKFDVVDYEEFFRKAELDIRENLQYTGIVEETENKTRRLMVGMLKNLGYEEIYIEFEPVDRLFQPVNLEGEKEDVSE